MQIPSSVFLAVLLVFLGACSNIETKTQMDKKAEIYYGQGTSDLINKDYTQALKNLLKAAELDPKNSNIFNNLGMAYFFKKQVKTSLDHLKKALELDPKNSDARNNLASVYFSLGNYQDAEKQYLLVKEDLLYSQQFRVFYNLGLIQLKKHQIPAAKKFFLEALKNNEDYCPAHYRLGEIFLGARQYPEALEKFHAASKGTCYNEPAPHYYQGVVHLNMKDRERAKSKFLEVLDRFPQNYYAELSKEKLGTLTDVIAHQHGTIPSKRKTKKNSLQSSMDPLPPDLIDFTKGDKLDKTMENTFSTPNF